MASNTKAEMEQRELERLHYWQGQQLHSRDFHDLAQIEDQLRWWHNRSLHEIPGVREGFDVQVEGNALLIGCGLAYDGYGRELIHAQETIWPVDDTLPPEGLFLFVQAASSREGKRSWRGACIPAQVERSRKQVEFIWVRANEISTQNGVRLGRVYLGTDKLLHFEHEHRFARPFARPRIASGSTIPGATDWELWELKAGELIRSDQVLGLQVRVDSSTAGFIRSPCYFAWLHGVNWMNIQGEKLGLFDILTVEHIDEVSTHGFTFRLMLLMELSPDLKNSLFNFIQNIKPYICWIGIEPDLENTVIQREINDENF